MQGSRVPVERAGGVVQIGGDVAVGEHDALGLTGGPGGIDKRGQILRFDRELRNHRCISTAGAAVLEQSGERCAALSRSRDHPSQGCARVCRVRMADFSVLGSVETTVTRAPESISKRHLVRGERGIDGHIYRAKDQGGEVHHRPLPAILREDRDAIALKCPRIEKHWQENTRENNSSLDSGASCPMHPARGHRARACRFDQSDHIH